MFHLVIGGRRFFHRFTIKIMPKRSMESETTVNETVKKKKCFNWSEGLKESMNDPELKVDEDELCVIIKDKFPKAKHHYLVLPKESIPNLKTLKLEHLPLLEHIQKKGKSFAESLDHKWTFKMGYHAVPSMSHVHMHVISKDFDSSCLKTKKHWNSFTTEYFINSEDLIEKLKKGGKIETNDEKSQSLLKLKLKCHLCPEEFSTLPALKKHIAKHKPQ